MINHSHDGVLNDFGDKSLCCQCMNTTMYYCMMTTASVIPSMEDDFNKWKERYNDSAKKDKLIVIREIMQLIEGKGSCFENFLELLTYLASGTKQ
jgi:hypothetical protein